MSDTRRGCLIAIQSDLFERYGIKRSELEIEARVSAQVNGDEHYLAETLLRLAVHPEKLGVLAESFRSDRQQLGEPAKTLEAFLAGAMLGFVIGAIVWGFFGP